MGPSDETHYLIVDSFLKGVIEARSLATAFRLGLIDHLLTQSGKPSVEEVARHLRIDTAGLDLLLGLLRANGVVRDQAGGVVLTELFIEALSFRDLMESKLDFLHLVLPDFEDFFTALIARPDEFRHNARVFNLFSYDRCLQYTPENYERTRQWMRLTSALTRYEAPVCLRHYDFGRHARMLDIGGNSGEFSLQACRKHPGLKAWVFDLPLVCDIGKAHLSKESEAERIFFVKGNGLSDPLPNGFDLVSFKSMLHDWPERETERFLSKAVEALDTGGTLMIFERAPLEIGQATPSCASIPFLLFFRSFRGPRFYEECARTLGLQDITVKRIELETAFFLLTARKP